LDQRATLDWTAARQEIPAVSCVLATPAVIFRWAVAPVS